MASHNMQELVDGWLGYQRAADANGAGPENLFWAVSEVLDLTYDNPQALWDFILKTLEDPRSDEVMPVFAAGPVEDLLAKYGPDFIDRVEAEAHRNRRFASLLGGVWQKTMSDDIWRRVQCVWDRSGWDGIPAA
jgi:hypothetical protein